MVIKYSLKDIRNTIKPIDAWWTALIIDKMAIRLLWLFVNFTKITPNQITVVGFLFGLISAICFLQGQYIYLIIGALIYELGFIFDCMDGKLARLKNTKSKFGMYLDGVLDRWNIIFNLFALSYGQYLIHNDNIYLILGFIYSLIAAIGMFYLSAEESQIDKTFKSKGNQKPKGIVVKVQSYFNNKGLFFGISHIEIHTLVFFIFTLLNQVKIGFIITIVILLPLLLFRMYIFMSRIRKLERNG